MAKKETEKNSLDFDDLDDFNFDSPDMDFGPGSSDGKPVRKLATSFVSGVKDDMMNMQDINRKVKNVLPSSYSTTIDIASEGASTVGDLYNSITTETRQGVKDLKRATKRSLEGKRDKLPKWLADRLDKALATDDDRRMPTKDEIRQGEIDDKLADIFTAQTKLNEETQAQKESQQVIQEQLTQKRHATLMGQLVDIRQDIRRQVSYQDKVTARYQRKSLELQYYQLFTARDMLKLTEQVAKENKQALSAIVTNTGLPDYKKLQTHEAYGQQFRERMIDNFHNSVGSLAGGFIRNARRNLSERVRGKARDIGDQMSSMATMMDMLNDNSDYVDPMETLGSTAGSIAGRAALDRYAPRIRELLEKNPRIAQQGLKFTRFGASFNRKANEWAKKDHGPGPIGRIMNWIGESFNTVGKNSSIDIDGIENSRQPAIFDKATRRSINEIIPGYLSRIHHELRSFRSGMGVELHDDNTRLTYDPKSRDFRSRQSMKTTVRRDIFRRDELDRAQDSLNDLYKTADIEQYIPKKHRMAARRHLLERAIHTNLEGDDLDVKKLSRRGYYGERVPDDVAEALARAFQKRYGLREEIDDKGRSRIVQNADAETDQRQTKFIGQYNNLTRNLTDPKNRIVGYAQLGNEDALSDIGVVEHDAYGRPRVNYENIVRAIQQGGLDEDLPQSDFHREELRRYNQHWIDLEKKQKAQELDRRMNRLGRGPESSGEYLDRRLNQFFQQQQQRVRRHTGNIRQNIKAADYPAQVREALKRGQYYATTAEGRHQAGDYVRTKRRDLHADLLNRQEQLRNLDWREASFKTRDYIRDRGGNIQDRVADHELTQKARNAAQRAAESEQGQRAINIAQRARGQVQDRYNEAKTYVQQSEQGQRAQQALNRARSTAQEKWAQIPSIRSIGEQIGGEHSDAMVGKIMEHELYRKAQQGRANTVEFVRKMGDNGRGLAKDLDRRSRDEIGQLSRRLNELTETIRNIDVNEEGRRAAGRLRNFTRDTRGLGDSFATSARMAGQRAGIYTRTRYDSLTDGFRSRGETDPESIGLGGRHQSLSSTLLGIRNILNGKAAGVGRDTRTIVKHLTSEKVPDDKLAEYAVLCRILETVEGLGQVMTQGDEKSRLSLKGIARKSGRILGRVGSSLGSFYLGGLRMFGGGMGGAGSVALGAGRMGGNLLGRLFRGRRHFKATPDVYVEGREQPALRGRAIDRGDVYFDQATGQPIASLEDLGHLKGDVVDAEDRTVVTLSELADGVFDAKGNPLGKSGILSGIKHALSNALSTIGGIYTSPLRIANRGRQFLQRQVKRYVNRVQDVYVKGEQEPRLLAVVMKNGGYVSAHTGRPIYNLKQIDGDILDRQGNVVLSLADMQRGLVNRHGRPIDFLDRQLSRLKSLVKAPINLARKGWNKLHDGFNWGKDKVSSFLNKTGLGFGHGSEERKVANDIDHEQLKVLKQIRDLLKKQYGTSTPWDDTNHDGLRDGSWQALFAKRKKKKPSDDTQKPKDEEEDHDSFLKKIMSYLTPILTLVGGKFLHLFGDIKDFLKKLLMARAARGGLGMAEDLAGGGRRRRGPGRRLTSRAGKGLWRLLKGTAKFGGKVLGGVGSLALMGGSSLLEGGGALLAGAASVISAPVLLTGAAVVGAGVAGYYLWKHFTKASRDLGPMAKQRMMQYGVHPTNSEQVGKILYLENELKDKVTFQDGEPQLKSQLDWKKVLKQFGGDPTDQDSVHGFAMWYNGRFLPVFFAAKTGQHRLEKPVALDKVDEIKSPVERKRYFEATRTIHPLRDSFPHPYEVNDSPFDAHGELSVSYWKIETNGQTIMNQLDDEIDKAGESEESMTVQGVKLPLRRHRSTTDKLHSNRTPGDTTKDLKTQAQQADQSKQDHRNILLRKPANQDDYVVKGQVKGQDNQVGHRNHVLAAQEAMLYKAMGLKELTPDKVNVLRALIDYVVPDLQITSKGDVNYAIKARDVFNAFRGRFGLLSGTEFLARQQWIRWFENRFLRVLMTYISTVLNGNASAQRALDEARTNPELAMRGGQMLVHLMIDVGDGSSMSVWAVTTSPWTGYELNQDPKSIYNYIEYLKSKRKEDKLRSKGEDGPSSSDKNKASTGFSNVLSKLNLGQMGKGDKEQLKRMQAAYVKANRGDSSSSSSSQNFYQSQNQSYHVGPNSLNGGMAVQQPGHGTGGDINNIPMPDGDHSWQAMSKTIVAAAKMAGVDSGLMATMAAIESGFRSKVGARTSRAQGLFQFIPKTWEAMLKKYGPKYGISLRTRPTDPRANALMAAEYLKQNENQIKDVVKGDVTDTDLYMAHFLGAGGARSMLSADPTENASRLLPAAARANPNIFRNSNGRARTVAEVYQVLNKKVSHSRDLYADKARNLARTYRVKTSQVAQNDDNAGPVENVTITRDTVAAPKATPPAPSKTPAGAGSGSASAVMVSSGIDSTQGMDQALNRNAAATHRHRAQQEQITANQEKQRQEHHQKTQKHMESVASVLKESLKVQQTMDQRLAGMHDLLSKWEDRAVEDREAAEKQAKEAQHHPNQTGQKSGLNFDPRNVADSVVGLHRRRSA